MSDGGEVRVFGGCAAQGSQKRISKMRKNRHVVIRFHFKDTFFVIPEI